ncbi:biopolymer transporter ExbD [Reichenbachiella carrageenanivorans]|uniref:Biopolymer transporter ExbD n=1 Tax=Reichenbachiella carrageenanivorans TaxID=2979869 RepID=A0ABY6D0Y8_9BACT|nr:biopolymer transporter ExbD [Reichenbachiella carrageenanivorans]UXX79290.1 biopolymer transporter ExbD [Reichenbachiella carrageenanivorans]
MKLGSKHKIESSFSMSSMTDVIFLLLIFFMLTSSFITPSGLPVNLPTSKSSTIVMQKISVTITPDLQYFVNDQKVELSGLERALKTELKDKEGVVVLHCDKSVPVEHLVNVASVATKLGSKISLATKPD